MSEIEEWERVNDRLADVCEKILPKIKSFSEGDLVAKILKGFFYKALKTLIAVNLLHKAGLHEQAQALARVLLELRINFDYFRLIFSKDREKAIFRISDSMILEKYKQMKASGFLGVEKEQIEKYESTISQIKNRHTPDEVLKMEKYGFSGLQLDQRAAAVNHDHLYNIVYRNFSKNIHSTDYSETMIYDVLDNDFRKSFFKERNRICLYTAHFSCGGIAELINQIFHCGFDEALNQIGRDQSKLREKL